MQSCGNALGSNSISAALMEECRITVAHMEEYSISATRMVDAVILRGRLNNDTERASSK
jgi:hypothetical protein